MSAIGFIAHALRPSTTSTETQHQNNPRNSPHTVTGNSYSIFTTENYGDNEMHWFWMVLICTLLLFAWWKLRRYCKCPGPSKQEHKDKRQAKWNRRQLEEIEEKINHYEKKLEVHQEPKKLPGPRAWSELQRSRILECCGAELRRLEEFIASEHISLPGSSNVLAVLYKGVAPDV